MKRKPKNGLNRSAYIRKLMSETEVIPATDIDYDTSARTVLLGRRQTHHLELRSGIKKSRKP